MIKNEFIKFKKIHVCFTNKSARASNVLNLKNWKKQLTHLDKKNMKKCKKKTKNTFFSPDRLRILRICFLKSIWQLVKKRDLAQRSFFSLILTSTLKIKFWESWDELVKKTCFVCFFYIFSCWFRSKYKSRFLLTKYFIFDFTFIRFYQSTRHIDVQCFLVFFTFLILKKSDLIAKKFFICVLRMVMSLIYLLV